MRKNTHPLIPGFYEVRVEQKEVAILISGARLERLAAKFSYQCVIKFLNDNRLHSMARVYATSMHNLYRYMCEHVVLGSIAYTLYCRHEKIKKLAYQKV